MCVDFVLLAEGTALDVATDEGGETGPPEFGGDQLSSFQEAGMSGRFMIMAPLKNGAAKGIIRGNIDTVFIGEDAGFDLPVSQPGMEGERDILMHGLEGLENEGITCGGRFDAVREGGVDEVDEQGRREEGDVGVVRVIHGEEVGPAGEGIGAGEKLSGDMDHFQVDEPMRLVAVERLGLAKIGKVLVVGEDLHRKGGAMKVVAPRFQGTDNGQEFAVIDVIVSFCGGEGLREVGTGVPIAIGIGLEEDGAGCVFRGVSGNSEGGGEVGKVKDGFGEKELFEGVKGGLASRGPVPREIFLGEVEEGAGDVGVIGDEVAVEIGEAKEGANVFHFGRGRPTCDSIELNRVHN